MKCSGKKAVGGKIVKNAGEMFFQKIPTIFSDALLTKTQYIV
jgi:hypothetical protein